MSYRFLKANRDIFILKSSTNLILPRTIKLARYTSIAQTSRLSLPSRSFSTFPRNMGSDEDYASFLEKANEDPSGGKASTQSTKQASTKAVDTDVPKLLEEVEEYYVSEGDEPFEPVSLKYSEKGVPSVEEFSDLIGKKAMNLSGKIFDPRGQYKKVVDAVAKASDGNVGYFSVDLAGARMEYFVVGVAKHGGSLVGLKAMVIQS